jgi:ABC-type branched-subunit amino acid transport system ATPase component
VVKRFGGLAAVNDVDLELWPGEVLGLIGPNGSGKTTLFDCLSRLTPVTSGQIVFKGGDITRKKPYQVARLGLARTFQVIRVYGRLPVLQNLELSLQWGDVGFAGLLRPCSAAVIARANELAEFFHLGSVRDELAMNLSGGQRRLLEIAMAMMPEPDVLLLDEATSGVNPTVIEQIKDRIRALNQDRGTSFLLIEHDIRFIADLCSRVIVLNYGEKLAEGTPTEIVENDDVIEAYFGIAEGSDDG